MRKKYIFAVLGILALAAVVFVVVKVRQTGEEAAVTPRKPDIPNYVVGKLPIEILVKPEGFNFPARLPTLSVTKRSFDKNIAVSFAEKLGVGSTLDEFEDINEGIKYYASTDKYFFIATPKTSVIKFGLSVSELPAVASKGIGDNEFISIATKFLTDNGFYTEEQIKPLPIAYFKSSPVTEGLEKTDRASAGLFEVGFIPSSSEFDILTNYSAAPQILLQILPDGTMYNAEVLLVSSIQKGLTDYPLKAYEDVVAGLGEARLIGLSGDYISPSDLMIKDISSLKVEKISLVYLLEQGKEDLLQPIFLLEGPAVIRNSTANYAVIYMPAYK